MSLVDKLLLLLGFKPYTDVVAMLRRAPREVDVVVEYPRGEKLPGDVSEALELAVNGSRGRVRLDERVVDEWGYEYPPPRISVGGLLEGRVEFYGGLPDVLVGVFGEALLQASGAGREECPKRTRPVEADTVLYVVAGIPCLRAGTMIVRLARCWRGLRVRIVEVKAYEKWRGRRPVDETPSLFVNGEYAAAGAPASIEALAKTIRETAG